MCTSFFIFADAALLFDRDEDDVRRDTASIAAPVGPECLLAREHSRLLHRDTLATSRKLRFWMTSATQSSPSSNIQAAIAMGAERMLARSLHWGVG